MRDIPGEKVFRQLFVVNGVAVGRVRYPEMAALANSSSVRKDNRFTARCVYGLGYLLHIIFQTGPRTNRIVWERVQGLVVEGPLGPADATSLSWKPVTYAAGVVTGDA